MQPVAIGISSAANVRFGSKADIALGSGHVRFTPKSGHRSARRQCPLCAKSGLMRCNKILLFDHLVGACEQRRRDGQAECLRGLQINDQLEFSWRLHRQVRRFLPLEDAIDIIRRFAHCVFVVVTVADESPGFHGRGCCEMRRDTMLQSQRDDQALVGPGEGMRVDDDAAVFLSREGRYRPLYFGRIVDAARVASTPKRGAAASSERQNA
jgi:hypothetical protein